MTDVLFEVFTMWGDKPAYFKHRGSDHTVVAPNTPLSYSINVGNSYEENSTHTNTLTLCILSSFQCLNILFHNEATVCGRLQFLTTRKKVQKSHPHLFCIKSNKNICPCPEVCWAFCVSRSQVAIGKYYRSLLFYVFLFPCRASHCCFC